MATRHVLIQLKSGFVNASADSATLDVLNWGNGITDAVRFTSLIGSIIQFNWLGVYSVRESNVPPPPESPPLEPPLPNWRLDIWFEGETGTSFSVSDTVKGQILADLEGPGSEDSIVTFDTLENYRLRFPTKALACITFVAQS